MGSMGSTTELENPGTKFTQVLDAAAKLPGVRINRAAYLRAALKRYCTAEEIEAAITATPAIAGIPLSVITQAANTSIKYETSKVTGLSTVAGVPGGFAMFGTVPADLAQYMSQCFASLRSLPICRAGPTSLPTGRN